VKSDAKIALSRVKKAFGGNFVTSHSLLQYEDVQRSHNIPQPAYLGRKEQAETAG
jgi:hypothetical protein